MGGPPKRYERFGEQKVCYPRQESNRDPSIFSLVTITTEHHGSQTVSCHIRIDINL